MINWVFTAPQTDGFGLMPMAIEDGAGLMLTYSDGGSGDSSKEGKELQPRFRYQLAGSDLDAG